MYNSHSNDRASEISQKALKRITEHGLPMLPAIYEVWYVHFSGENPELSHAIQLIDMDKSQTFDRNNCLEIYEKFLSQNEQAENVREAGNQVQTTISNLNTLVKDVHNTTADYNENLTNLSNKLDQNSYSQDEIQGLVKTIATDTTTILQKINA